MAHNSGKLAGRTIFISGASRGIGKAIALKCARDGANIAIAAKTATANPKLPGTIYTAAEEIEKAGGKALPCIVDIQSEDAVQKAISETVSKFGGIDVLINNASAIHMTGTVATPMKRYDLMHGINTRGTFLCSKYAAPYLKDGVNPHILNISPPLNMSPKWFKNHVAYTMAKYGMSMCVLGMAEEFKEDKIAVNALWPKTAIYTAAMAMLGGGEGIRSQCRSVDIMSDAAYVMLTKDSGSYTGNFAIDENVLKDAGITDFTKYLEVPDAEPLPDFFIDEYDPDELKKEMEAKGNKPRFGGSRGATDSEDSKAPSSSSSSSGSAVGQTFQTIQTLLSEEMVKSMGAVYSFDIKDGGEWYVDLKNGSGSSGEGAPPQGAADVTFTLDADNFVKMFAGKINPTTAFMTGKMKIKGDLGLAMKLEKLMKQARSAVKPSNPSSGGQAAGGGGSALGQSFQSIQSIITEDMVKSIKAVYAFNITDGGEWYVDLKNGSGSSGEGAPPQGAADVTFTIDSDNFVKMFSGKVSPTTAFMSGKLKIKGDLGLAMKLEKLMKQARSKL